MSLMPTRDCADPGSELLLAHGWLGSSGTFSAPPCSTQTPSGQKGGEKSQLDGELPHPSLQQELGKWDCTGKNAPGPALRGGERGNRPLTLQNLKRGGQKVFWGQNSKKRGNLGIFFFWLRLWGILRGVSKIFDFIFILFLGEVF